MSEKKEVYWHLPGLCYFRLLNQVLINTMKDYPERFREGYRIGSVYGTIPGAIWNGGRAVFGICNKAEIERVLHTYNQHGIPARFTWSNSLLEEKHVYDTYCNMIMKLGDNGLNQAIVNRPVLEEYIRREYPGYKLISSTTKRMTDTKLLAEEVAKDYFLVVLDYDLNRNEEVIKQLEPVAGKIEILVNEICYPGCVKRAEHYREESRSQLEFDNRTDFRCPNHSRDNRTFEECMKRPAFMTTDEVERYIERGFVNFKIVGRGLPQQFVLDSYLYFLVKEEHREFIRKHMVDTINQLMMAQRSMAKR